MPRLRSRFTVRRLMMAVAILGLTFGACASVYRLAMRRIYLAEAGNFRDREARAAHPGIKAENAERATYYERLYRQFGGR